MGPHQAKQKLACFCFQTNGRSALRIIYSKTLEYPNHIDHLFVKWTLGSCPDGRYFWLKKDTCPATGKPYGLDRNATAMVRSGLADLVPMETPDAEIRIARLLNQKLAACDRQKRALPLYSFSPSFTWDRQLTSRLSEAFKGLWKKGSKCLKLRQATDGGMIGLGRISRWPTSGRTA